MRKAKITYSPKGDVLKVSLSGFEGNSCQPLATHIKTASHAGKENVTYHPDQGCEPVEADYATEEEYNTDD